jgi:hypothetical protein
VQDRKRSLRIHLGERFDLDEELLHNPSLHLDGSMRATFTQQKWTRDFSQHLRERGVLLEVELALLPKWEGSVDDFVGAALSFEPGAD